ncbi:MAG: trypsin-like peptidase domain-containing protein [Chloroflexi bacterium]|nr:trypsin-like peptidase domain-containing protein [Chloroflexota bacterium]
MQRSIPIRLVLPARASFRFLFAAVLAASALLAQAPAATLAQRASSEVQRNFEIVNGHFYTETGASRTGDQGYSITDEGGIPLWSEFQRLGGVDVLGYPVSQRFMWDGFVVQATQKVVLQWRPDLGRAVFVNLFDELSAAGKDDWLAAHRLIPKPAAFTDEASLSFDQIVQKRLRLLDSYPALRAAYLTAPDPIAINGVPVAPVADIGPALVLRAQRRAFQLWKVATPFARPGDVTVVNGGDLGKEADLYPAPAMQPEPAWRQIAAPPASNTRLPVDEVAALRQLIERARPAVVKLTDNQQGFGTGIIYDPSGLVLTNSHVVASLAGGRLRALLPDGRSLAAQPLGADDWTDVAVVKIEAPNLPYVPLGSAQSLALGERVLALGYAPLLPGAPSAKTGVIRSLAGEIQTFQDYPLFNLITTNALLYPGDSGGPLLNRSGQVVGINTAIRVSRRGQDLTGFSIPIEGARQIAEQIVASGGVARPHFGISVADVTPSLALTLGAPVSRGVLVREVTPDSPAAAEIQPGDIIVAMDGQDVTGLDDLRRLMVKHSVGDVVPLTIVSPGAPRRTVSLTLAERAAVRRASFDESRPPSYDALDSADSLV